MLSTLEVHNIHEMHLSYVFKIRMLKHSFNWLQVILHDQEIAGTVEFSIFGCLDIASFYCETCKDDATSLRFRFQKAIIVFASHFLLVSADGGELLFRKLSLWAPRIHSNKVLHLKKKLLEIYYHIRVNLVSTFKLGKINCAFKAPPKTSVTRGHSTMYGAADALRRFVCFVSCNTSRIPWYFLHLCG